jgi:hypothetical protein
LYDYFLFKPSANRIPKVSDLSTKKEDYITLITIFYASNIIFIFLSIIAGFLFLSKFHDKIILIFQLICLLPLLSANQNTFLLKFILGEHLEENLDVLGQT